MTQKENQELLVALCGYLPYNVKCYVPTRDKIMILTGKRLNYFCFHDESFGLDFSHEIEIVSDPWNSDNVVKPILRSLSNMTEEECVELAKLRPNLDVAAWKYIKTPVPLHVANVAQFDFFNSHFLDWRGLIKKGLAIEASEGFYKYQKTKR